MEPRYLTITNLRLTWIISGHARSPSIDKFSEKGKGSRGVRNNLGTRFSALTALRKDWRGGRPRKRAVRSAQEDFRGRGRGTGGALLLIAEDGEA